MLREASECGGEGASRPACGVLMLCLLVVVVVVVVVVLLLLLLLLLLLVFRVRMPRVGRLAARLERTSFRAAPFFVARGRLPSPLAFVPPAAESKSCHPIEAINAQYGSADVFCQSEARAHEMILLVFRFVPLVLPPQTPSRIAPFAPSPSPISSPCSSFGPSCFLPMLQCSSLCCCLLPPLLLPLPSVSHHPSVQFPTFPTSPTAAPAPAPCWGGSPGAAVL